MQVKSTGTPPSGKIYRVTTTRHNPAGRRVSRSQVPYTALQVDSIAAFLVPENAWYIIPIAIASGRKSLGIHALDHPKRGRWVPYFEAWRLLEATGEGQGLPVPGQDTVEPAPALVSTVTTVSALAPGNEAELAETSGTRCSNCRLIHAFLSVLGK